MEKTINNKLYMVDFDEILIYVNNDLYCNMVLNYLINKNLLTDFWQKTNKPLTLNMVFNIVNSFKEIEHNIKTKIKNAFILNSYIEEEEYFL